MNRLEVAVQEGKEFGCNKQSRHMHGWVFVKRSMTVIDSCTKK